MTAERRLITILLADDDEDDRMLARDALAESRLANDLYMVSDGEELMDYLLRRGEYAELADSPRPGLILLDLNMPKMDGREALKEIKSHPNLRQIPVVVLTTSQAEEDIYRTYDLGANTSAGKLFGVAADDLIGRSVEDFIEPGQSGDIARKWQEFLADGSMKGVMRVRRPDGERVDVDYSAKANILPGRHLSVLRDITEQKRIEEALREADRRAIYEYALLLDRIAALAQALGTARELPVIYRALQDFSVASVPCCGIFISLYDQKRNERQAVYAWSEGEEVDLTDLPPMPMNESPHSRAVATGQVIITDDFQAATVGLPVHDVGLEKDPRRPQSSLAVPMTVMGRIVGAIETQSPEPAAYTQEHATALRMAANMAANAVENVQLIERERRHGERLRQAQKMEAVGHLAGGVAHDFNNLLTVINGYSDLALKRAESEPLRRQLEEIRKAGERASSLTRQLLAFSRKQVLQPEPLNLNDVVAGTIKMLHRLIGEDIEITTAFKPDLGQVKADPGQIEQVLMNLVVNARDAMPDGGRISIRTENVEMNEGVAKMYESVRAGAHVRLTVSDTGCGMDVETKSHIFEPFFTTKEVGKGTGLGLSTVYGIVKQSDGYISVYSEVGHGTSFRIYLPRIEDDIEVEKSIAKESPRGDETVLLVEDDELLIKIAHTILEERGYTVLAASSGTEALRICREQQGAIGLMLTDLVMPQMSGKELAVRAAALRPEMKTLYMSGYTDDVVVHHGVLEEGIAFLEKPFTPETLARKVRETLDAAD